MFVASLLALAVGSLIAALATNIGVMILARVIQGIGGAVIPLAFGIIRDEFPREKVAGAIGSIAALLAVGGGLGLVLAGPIEGALNYHWLFWIPMVICIIGAAAAYFFVPESPIRTPGRINWVSAILLSGWLVALLVGVSQAPSWGWGSGRVIGLFFIAIAVAAIWFMSEVRSTEPLIDMKMMRITAVWTTNLVAFLFGIVMYSIFAFLPEFLQTPKDTGYGFGASVTSSGLLLLPMTIANFIAGIAVGRLANRFGAKAVLVFGSALTVVPLAMLAFAHDNTAEILVATILIGLGFGMSFAAISGIIVGAVSPQQTGVASGMNANIRTIGGSIGAAVVASIVTANIAPTGLPEESGYTNGFAFLAVAILFAAIAGLFIPTGKADETVVHMVPEASPSK